MDEKVRSGYNDIKVTMKAKGDLSEAELQEMVKVAKARSPVYDMVNNPVPVAVEIVK